MNYFFTTTLQSFFGIALLAGLLWCRHALPALRALVWTTLVGLVVGLLCGLWFRGSQPVQLLIVSAEMLVLLLFLLSFWWVPNAMRYLWQGILVFGAARHWALDPNLSGLTSTHVLNTDLLLNLTATALAFALLSLAATLCGMLVARVRWMFWPLALVVLFMLWLPLSGNLLLLLMKLQVLPLAKPLLSFIAHVTNNAALFNWAGAGLLLLLGVCCLPMLWSRQRAVLAANEPIAQRLASAERRDALRLALTNVGCAAIVIASQLWWNLIASQPPRLSEAQTVTLASDGQVHLPIEQVRDGKLHRFVWTADDGKAVRFFVINSYPDKLHLGVVFDACLLCGDQGYVMEVNQIICVACGVHIFIPSIGKPGGCNPVPIENWRNDTRELVIPRASLAAGANYFSTVLTIPVVDPVDGTWLTNTAAEFKYVWAGKTWYFASEAHYNRFRDAPEQFAPSEMKE